jgi:hypothetical protein
MDADERARPAEAMADIRRHCWSREEGMLGPLALCVGRGRQTTLIDSRTSRHVVLTQPCGEGQKVRRVIGGAK